MVVNAGKELLDFLPELGKTVEDIEFIILVEEENYINYRKIICKYNPSNEDIANIGFKYDTGYGTQNLFGNVVFKDKSWLERGEYDGSEWWEYKTTPDIEQLIKEYGLD